VTDVLAIMQDFAQCRPVLPSELINDVHFCSLT